MKLSQLKEARYYGATAPSAQDVFKDYDKAAAHFNEQWGEMDSGQSPYSLTGPLMMGAEIHKKYYPGGEGDTHYTSLEMHFHMDVPPDSAEKWGIKFLKDNNLPFTDISPDDSEGGRNASWRLSVVYDIQGFDDKYKT